MLIFIGLGLYDEKDITLRGLEELKRCDMAFAELYTSYMPGLSLERLERLAGKRIELLSRREVEEGAEEVILKPAMHKTVALLVAGDPMVSTTHTALRLEAKRLGIATRVVHSASILSAAPSLSGLHNYKFGRSATVARPEAGFFPETPYNVVKENLSRGLHTLEKKHGEGVIREDTLAVVVSAAGAPDAGVVAGKIGELLRAELGAMPHTLIIPGELHFTEEEYLREFAGLGAIR